MKDMPMPPAEAGAPPPAMGAHLPRPSALGIWWLAARPKTLPAAATPVLVGSACAQASGALRPLPALAALAGALLLQVAANLANDVFDFEKGADTAARVGPLRVVQAGWVEPARVRRALGLVLLVALGVGAYLVSVSGPALVFLGLASIAAAVAYTGGPYPLGYHGLGDVCVFAFFGLAAVAGSAFVQAGHVPTLAWWCSVPMGSLATAILVVNNLRDIDTDRAAGKRTLAVRFGRSFAIAEYRALLAVAYATSAALSLGSVGPFGLLPFLTLPLALSHARRIERERGPALNALLAGTAALLLSFGLLLSLSVLLGAA